MDPKDVELAETVRLLRAELEQAERRLRVYREAQEKRYTALWGPVKAA